jgi:hypothetical protein
VHRILSKVSCHARVVALFGKSCLVHGRPQSSPVVSSSRLMPQDHSCTSSGPYTTCTMASESPDSASTRLCNLASPSPCTDFSMSRFESSSMVRQVRVVLM